MYCKLKKNAFVSLLAGNSKLLTIFIIRLVRSFILQGYLYIFAEKICFYSYFNDRNLLFGRTYLTIQLDDIIKIEKRPYMLFETGIAINTNDSESLFASVFIIIIILLLVSA